MRKAFIVAFALLLGVTSCDESKEKRNYLPGSTGAVNSLFVVVDNGLWNGAVGDRIRDHFAASIVGMPWDEPKFTITQIPPSVFKGTTTHARSLLLVTQDSVAQSYISPDAYAKPQRVAVVKGTTEAEMIAGLDAIAEEAMKSFRDNEMEEAQKRFKRSLSKTKVLEEKFGISLTLPSIYAVGREEDQFVWIDRPVENGTMNLLVYTMPSNSFSQDSTFVRDIIAMRDSIGKQFIPGPDMPGKVTYMKTEQIFAPSVFPTEVGGKKAAEIRGIWEIHNYPMAGPYVTFILNDKENDRKLVLEGFVFAPQTEKRDYMFELEAVIRSVRWLDPK